MQELQTFSNDMFSILIKQDNENNLFDLETVAKSLGFTQIKNGKQYIRWETINKYLGKYLSQEVGKGDFIPEPMVYKLAFKAGNSTAEKFQDWLAMEVLPAIRKHGIYATDSVIEQTIQNPDYIIHVLTEFKKEREGRLVAEQQVQELKPKATYYDLVLQNKSLLSVSKIAKDYGMSARALNKLLHELGVQYKQGDIWLLYAKHQDKGYTQTSTYALDEEHSKVTTKWTQKGRLFIYDLLKDNDILPTIEQLKGGHYEHSRGNKVSFRKR
ncbi:TPA: phage antirepressor KilAC domain-containing protein [Staphylococcus delphini]|nr:phage antirepressor KilAC domain-containing protein [Staphylococcus delphini]HEC2167419.1 phage antirepressor KilAC domain-containing protein [Staphylococcus delphini]HEC2229095.1 phage antirepressor KilAC domain-containing protein [Staphylococcus delphini]